MTDISNLAGIQYVGETGETEPCLNAVVCFLQMGSRLTETTVLTFNKRHALLLKIDSDYLVVVKAGFNSGYAGEGPRGLSKALALLNWHSIKINECFVSEEFFERLNASALTHDDMVDANGVTTSADWKNYIYDIHREQVSSGALWSEFDPLLPYPIIDARLLNFAIGFWDNPDAQLLNAYRRLEDIIRKRTGLPAHGAKLFSSAFAERDAKLHWPGLEKSEVGGRAQLFTSTYLTFRNPRAHRETFDVDRAALAREFLQLNNLYWLESLAETAGSQGG